jgi:glutaredoxin
MLCTPVRVSPDPKYIAEVVVLLTTLGAKRTEFNAGKRARDLLEIKRVHHKIIDFNRDARQAGTGEAENQAIQKLMAQGKLQTSENKDLTLPQIFIDGTFVGDATELQGLEDDGLLDAILTRRACIKCNDSRRTPETTKCISCWESFEEILPGMMTIEQLLQELAMMGECDFDDYDEDEEALEDYHEDDEDLGTAGPPVGHRVSAASASSHFSASRGSSHWQAPKEDVKEVSKSTLAETFREDLKAKAKWAVGDQVQYWSDTKNRWVDALVEGVRDKDGKLVFDLNCKRGADPSKVRGYDATPPS